LERQALDYRDRAEGFRTVAEGTRSAAARQALLNLAQTADEMAGRIEAQVHTLKRA
jgi:hypothetical protein